MFKRNINKHQVLVLLGLVAILISGCAKLIEVAPPRGSINADNAFTSDAKINAAVAAIYSEMINEGDVTLTNGAMSCLGGLLADELQPAGIGMTTFDQNYYKGNILRDDLNSTRMWSQPYHIIYSANSVLEGLKKYADGVGVTDSVRRIAEGQARFARAFCYFYLVNTFGEVPLLTSTDINKNIAAPRTSVDKAYDLIIEDLKDAQQTLSYGYKFSGDKKIMPNQLTATALLARVYLYRQRWAEAAEQASIVINSHVYTLTDPKVTFRANNTESLWELAFTNNNATTAINEATMMVPLARLSLYPDLEPMFTDSAMFEINAGLGFAIPFYQLRTQTFDAFEAGDLRVKYWTDRVLTPDSYPYFGVPFRFISKYNNVDGMANTGGDLSNMVFRLSELYLIRAEALAHGAESAGDAIADVNVVRKRAGLQDLPALSGDQLLAAIAKENRIEFLGEWGHRWLDLKRTNKANEVLGALDYKQPWDGHALLLPIPLSEITNSPNLKQNPGY